MRAPVFQWLPEVRLVAPGDTEDLRALRDAIVAGAEFSVGPDGVVSVPDGDRGFFRVRSGGTTGSAKSIRRSHASWIASFDTNKARLGLTGDDTYGILGLPVHSLALYAIIEAAHLGANICHLAGLRPRAQIRNLSDHDATILYATPTQLRLLVGVGVSLPAVRHVICGGGHTQHTLRDQAQAMCPNAVIHEFYGAAETSFIAWGDGSGPKGTVGRVYPGVEVRIAPSDGPFGEIWVRSPYLFEGYVDGESADTVLKDSFLSVGELGALDADGFLTVAGRKSRMVTVADQNVFPEDIEAKLLELGDITHCAVVALPDEARGQILVAVVNAALSDDARESKMRECRAAFGTLAAPRRIVTLEDFPLTAAGKPNLAEIGHRLEALAWRGFG